MNNQSELLMSLKRKVMITWNDEETDAQLLQIIDSAISVMQHKIGDDKIDFCIPGIEKTLFLEYCKYVLNDYGHAFDRDYRSQIITARSLHGNS